MRIDELGVRICILGPSNSGKSTLAAAIGRARGLPVVHLDQLRHRPGEQWQERSNEEFAQLHDAAISDERWVIEGNYSRLLPKRLERATGFILLDASTGASLIRYLRRTWSTRERHGGLEGVRDRVSVGMIRYIAGAGRVNRRGYRDVFEGRRPPKLLLPNRAALREFYRRENLTR